MIRGLLTSHYERREPWRRPPLPLALALGYATLESGPYGRVISVEPEDWEIDGLTWDRPVRRDRLRALAGPDDADADRVVVRAKRFVVTRGAVDPARVLLGVIDPVVIALTSFKRDSGRVVGFTDGHWRVSLHRGLRAADANFTLWHELRHLRQAQDLGGYRAWDDRIIRERQKAPLSARALDNGGRRGVRAYNRMPLERDANDFARRHEHIPLARRRQRGE